MNQPILEQLPIASILAAVRKGRLSDFKQELEGKVQFLMGGDLYLLCQVHLVYVLYRNLFKRCYEVYRSESGGSEGRLPISHLVAAFSMSDSAAWGSDAVECVAANLIQRVIGQALFVGNSQGLHFARKADDRPQQKEAIPTLWRSPVCSVIN